MMWIYLTVGAALGVAGAMLINKSSRNSEAQVAAVSTQRKYLGGFIGGAVGLLIAGVIGITAGNAVDAANELRDEFARAEEDASRGFSRRASSRVVEVDTKSFAEHTGKGIVIADFWAEWCGPCKLQAPILEDFANKSGDALKIVKINVDKHPELAERFGVTGLPSLVFFNDGEVIGGLVGLQNENTLVQAVEKVREISAQKLQSGEAIQ